jgi:GNAT superfamily N-acetyltransferase
MRRKSWRKTSRIYSDRPCSGVCPASLAQVSVVVPEGVGSLAGMVEELAGVTVRLAHTDDLDSLLVLLREFADAPAPGRTAAAPAEGQHARAILATILDQPGRALLVAERDGEVVGTADLLIVPNLMRQGAPWAIVENVVVSERLRRHGIGRALFEEVLRLAREAGSYKLQLISNKHRGEAHAFYRSVGFVATAEGFRLYLE